MHFTHVRRALSLWVDIAQSDGSVQTLEGEVQVHPGDGVVLGVMGERWPVSAVVFANRYRPIQPTTAGQSGYYRRVPIKVSAQQFVNPQEVVVAAGPLQAQAGDWHVIGEDGQVSVVAADLFDQMHEVIGLNWVDALGSVLPGLPLPWLPDDARACLVADLRGLNLLRGRKLTPYYAFGAARCLERILFLHPKARTGSDSAGELTVLQCIDRLALSAHMDSGQAAAANNIRLLGNDARHLKSAFRSEDEAFIDSLLCVFLDWALGVDGKLTLLSSCPQPEVVQLVQAVKASDCVPAFETLASTVRQHGDALMLFAVERALDFGEVPVAQRLVERLRQQGQSHSRRFYQLEALLASRSGQLDKAMQLARRHLTPLRKRVLETDPLYQDSQGITGGIYKRLWRKRGQIEDLRDAHHAYAEAWAHGGSFYTGINCAATLLWLRQTEQARSLALDVLDMIEPDVDESADIDSVQRAPWLYATYAEACLLAGHAAMAREWHQRLRDALQRPLAGVWQAFEQQWLTHVQHLSRADHSPVGR
jgi:hypothetical protein